MAEVEVKNQSNEVVGKLELSDAVFAYSASETLVWEAVRAYLANQRKGTHSTKVRSEVRGSGKKLWRQKGTGRARIGSIRSPLWRKGGVVFGPRPRDYSQSLPKKKRRGAIKLALTDKLNHGRLLVIEDLEMESHRTRDFAALLAKFQLDGKVLVVDGRENRNLFLGSRNLPRVKMSTEAGINIHDLLAHEHLMISRGSVLALQEALEK